MVCLAMTYRIPSLRENSSALSNFLPGHLESGDPLSTFEIQLVLLTDKKAF